jgi:hypothetical protein
MTQVLLQEYLSLVISRLESEGYGISKNIKYKQIIFTHVALKRNFRLERGGIYHNYFIFAYFAQPSLNNLREFSSSAFSYAKSATGLRPPRGLFFNLGCFPVAIVDSIDDTTAKLIKKEDPPRHLSSSEKLTVVDLKNQTFIYSETSPYWGSLYQDVDRALIESILSITK